MKAHEMVAEVRNTEIEIQKCISDIVNDKLKQLTDKTGLCIGGIMIPFIDATSINDESRTYKIWDVKVDAYLPDKIG